MKRRIASLAAVFLLTLVITGCERQKIADIKGDPGRFEGKEVSVAGHVTSVSVGALGMGFYEIDDGTGKLYVLSEKRGAPSEGTNVGVKGTVMPTFTFLGRNYALVLRESDRRGL
jgi:hypothetical protein